MRKLFFGVMVIGLLLVPILTGQKQQSRATSAAILARGKYLVEDVGMCGDCHTPRNEKGEPVDGQSLWGSLLSFGPTRRLTLRDFRAGRKTRRSSFS